ncbi:mitochondrial 37S ribosomal protein uS4m [Aspergillus homomorphus CBS 101889]|uniref:Small ribosomal subunit protein uS4m n=1 Tax=Aspergillus homomorphus (strain CBS 101889) TaxID=1450537 RepID=A0A395HUC5_ASPHC|nr:putative 30S ribosomal subunit S4 [Aspergillus homomorphus CBS 101889]RAL11400.1 putative 30S ribosomal subunit S4 [Aspergillus homomorphus CBS 101889]
MRNRATTSLNKPKIRQSWSKYNLYNLSRIRPPHFGQRTFFQQKWASKSMARDYHGEQVPEKKWQRMFSPRMRSVVPMSSFEMAKDDGSSQSAGRGSGLDKKPGAPDTLEKFIRSRRVPYTQMTFAPLERRLDTAIFRAMFASSARQARQFVVHGAVTVNGKPMRYPGYLLNPGDMFQVEPERVMYATGAPKDRNERRQTRAARKEKAAAKEAEEAAEEAASTEEAKDETKGEAKEEAAVETESPRETLTALLAQAKNIMSRSKDVLPAKRKQELRGFQKAVRRILSRSGSSTVLTTNLEEQFAELTTLLKAKRAEKPSDSKAKEENGENSEEATAEKPSTENSASEDVAGKAPENSPITTQLAEAFRQATQNPEQDVDASELTDHEFEVLRRALIQMRDNPIDSTKPYATPWRPREYMSAFAMIPRYLEVNHNICAAVYLRHPVARPGWTEVPSPFGEATHTPAFLWYLRRR